MVNYYVYEHVNKYNNKRYFGITCLEPSKRWGDNGINYRKNNKFLTDILRYGWINFEHNILFKDLSSTDAKRTEKELITKFKTHNIKYGYNVRISDNWSEESKLSLIRPESVKKAMRELSSKKIQCDGMIFDSINACAKYYNLKPEKVGRWLNGYTKMPNDYIVKDLRFFNAVVVVR